MLFKVSDSNIKGSIGEHAIVTDLLKRGLQVFRPAFEGCTVDVIAFNSEDRMFKIQVKALSKQIDGTVKLTSNSKLRAPLHEHYDDIDLFAVYVIDTDQILYIPKDHIGENVATLSVSFIRGRNCASNFLDFPFHIGSPTVGAEEEMKALLT